jgi:transposase
VREKKNRAARRIPAIANALEGMSRAPAALAVGMERQALSDALLCCSAEGSEGLYDRPTPGRPPALTAVELALLWARISRGPSPETDGVSSWTLPNLCRWIKDRFNKRLPPRSLSRILRLNGFSRQKTRPTHPKTDEAAKQRTKKGPSGGVGGRGGGHLGKRVIPWLQDEMRVGQRARCDHRWWACGKRPLGVQDQRHQWAYLSAPTARALRPPSRWSCPPSSPARCSFAVKTIPWRLLKKPYQGVAGADRGAPVPRITRMKRRAASASFLRFIAIAVSRAWIFMLSRPRRIALARPCSTLAVPWVPSTRQRWRA